MYSHASHDHVMCPYANSYRLFQQLHAILHIETESERETGEREYVKHCGLLPGWKNGFPISLSLSIYIYVFIYRYTYILYR